MVTTLDYANNSYTIGSPYYRTEVGAHENSDSPYGTFDQAGNVMEWTEAVLYTSYRIQRGGSFDDYGMHASLRSDSTSTNQYDVVGFRLVRVPEPATMALLLLAGVGIIRRKRA